MSDRAIVWKFAFGTLVLLFCGITWITRQVAGPVEAGPELAPVQAVPADTGVASPAASAPAMPAAQEPAPADLPEAQEVPARARVLLPEAPRARNGARWKAPRWKNHKTAQRSRTHVKHPGSRRKRRAMPAAAATAGQAHYPFDPRERWASREAG